MNRIGLAALSAIALLLAASGTAVATSPRKHHKRHTRVRHSHRVRTPIVDIAPANAGAPTTMAPEDNTGTAASFTNGVLTLKRNRTGVNHPVGGQGGRQAAQSQSASPTGTSGGDGTADSPASHSSHAGGDSSG
jgi:hypothetical protein